MLPDSSCEDRTKEARLKGFGRRSALVAASPCLLNSTHARAGEGAGKPGTDKDFWNRALQTPISDKQPARGSDVHYPELYSGGAGGAAVQSGKVRLLPIGHFPGVTCQCLLSPCPQEVGSHNCSSWLPCRHFCLASSYMYCLTGDVPLTPALSCALELTCAVSPGGLYL